MRYHNVCLISTIGVLLGSLTPYFLFSENMKDESFLLVVSQPLVGIMEVLFTQVLYKTCILWIYISTFLYFILFSSRFCFTFLSISTFIDSLGTKRAIEAFADSLRLEMMEFGVSVSIVEPGYIKTNIENAGIYFFLIKSKPSMF